MRRGSKAAGTALKLANSPDIFLATIQIGITLVGILTRSLLGRRTGPAVRTRNRQNRTAAALRCEVISQTLIVVVVTYLTLIIGELVPKRIGMTAAEKVSKLVARPMYLFSRIGRPFVWLLSCSTNGVMRMIGLDKAGESKVTEEEIKAIIQEGAEDGEVQEVEQELVERVFNLGDRNVGSIMTHRSELVWLNISDDNEQIKRIVESNLYNAYPVADHTLDNIVGVVYLKDLFGKLDTPGFTLPGRCCARPSTSRKN
ncbi:MAG: hemolysin family protein [Alistipes indistinctus]